MIKTLIQNAVICNKCNEYIFSKHRHDFVTCKCGNISVDGGLAYLRRIGKGVSDKSYTDASREIDEEALAACIKAVDWGHTTGRNNLGIALAVIRALEEHNLVVDMGVKHNVSQ